MSDVQACVYASLMLYDAGQKIEAAKIAAAVKAAGIEVRESLPIIVSNFANKKGVKELIASAAAAPSAGAGAAAAPAADSKSAPAADAKKDDKKAKKEEKVEEDDAMGLDLFS